MPPLRERREDIPLLVRYFLNRYARKAGRRFSTVDKKSLDLLQSYAWPGNIRELQNVIERSVIVSESFMAPQGLPLAVVVTILWLLAAFRLRSVYAGLLRPQLPA